MDIETQKISTQHYCTIKRLGDIDERIKLAASPWVGITFSIDSLLNINTTHCIMRGEQLFMVGGDKFLSKFIEEEHGK